MYRRCNTIREFRELYPEQLRDEPVREKRIEPVLALKMQEGIPVLKFPGLEACGKVEHLFSTRAGGVSSGMFATMNFSMNLGDTPENVFENYHRMAKALGCGYEDLTSTRQTHTTNIRRVYSTDRGKGICLPADYQDVDGLVTNVPGITLVAFTADCVPIYFVDPVNNAIGLAHSGWRGTVGNMAGKMVSMMNREFGTRPEELLVAIGPSICQSCYEVDREVAQCFEEVLGDCTPELQAVRDAGKYPMEREYGLRRPLEAGSREGKYQLDLWLVNLILLKRAGVEPGQVEVTDLCTAHNPTLLFSHRASGGKRGNLGAFLRIKEEVTK